MNYSENNLAHGLKLHLLCAIFNLKCLCNCLVSC